MSLAFAILVWCVTFFALVIWAHRPPWSEVDVPVAAILSLVPAGVVYAVVTIAAQF